MDTLAGVFFDLMYSIGVNAILIICGLCGIYRVKAQKGRWGWYIVGTILTLTSAFGCITGVERRGGVYSQTDVLMLGSQAVFLILFFVLTKKAINAQHSTQTKATSPKPNGKARLYMKPNIARFAFWSLFYIDLIVISGVIGACFENSPDFDSGSIIVLLILALILVGGTFFLYRCYNPFKEKYYSVHETPLRYHKFFCYVSLPLGILLTIASVFEVFSAEDFPSNSFYFIDLAYSFSSLALMCICFIWLRKWKSYAWRALMINYLLEAIYLVAAVIFNIIFSPALLDSSLTTLMIYIYVAAMTCLYYYKRKALFLSPNLATDLCVQPDYLESSDLVGEVTSSEGAFSEINAPIVTPFESVPIRFCRNCGYELDENSNFCSQCGTSVIRKW